MKTGSILTRDVLSALSTQYSQNSLLNSIYYYHYLENRLGYLVIDQVSKTMLSIDCGDYETSRIKVETIMNEIGCSYDYMFLTSSHPSKSQAISKWTSRQPNMKVFHGGQSTPFINQIEEGQIINIGNLCVFALQTPGTSKDAVTYVITNISNESNKFPVAFTGDTLYVSGCGQAEDPEALYKSLIKLRSLPNETMILPAIDNAMKNLILTKLLDAKNEILNEKINLAKKDQLYIGSVLAEERLYNPFLRCESEYFKELTGEQIPARVFMKLRALMDKFQ